MSDPVYWGLQMPCFASAFRSDRRQCGTCWGPISVENDFKPKWPSHQLRGSILSAYDHHDKEVYGAAPCAADH